VRDYYEQLWERLSAVTHPRDLALRRSFLLAHARAGDRALDIGCGDGHFSGVLADAAMTVTGADVAEAALVRARQRHPGLRFERVPFDGELPFEDGAFELVWASEVIEHVADTGRWLSEIRRVLTPRGRLLLTTPSHGRVRLARYGIEALAPPLGDHLHLYTRRSLARLLNEFGFAPVTVRAAGGLPPMRRLLLGHAQR
jgi:ubiquinone/menaquinone biosynthesis C-methylase UbiE